ncbi:hypothetical protein [Skermania piniformis]|uniref:Fe-S oxidoreductase n=1 Tax=Skermania pinensis TaxID=39122 RepID=A0ABX8SDF9_9ACTN|nr:hypothetical protein [Skermania piniformis]QXQ15970.1 hypothetical protein KV203_15605 [Skermania piniformis]
MLVTVLALGWARLWRAEIRFHEHFDIYVCAGMRGGFARGGTTVGGAYLTRNLTWFRTLRHESVHADQWARYGLTFIPRYLLEESRHPGAGNRFEIAAGLADGGYSVERPGPDSAVSGTT